MSKRKRRGGGEEEERRGTRSFNAEAQNTPRKATANESEKTRRAAGAC
jgi:hypothetical protein